MEGKDNYYDGKSGIHYRREQKNAFLIKEQAQSLKII